MSLPGMTPPTGAGGPGGLGRSRVLLTGATGFLGQALLERLLHDHPGVEVVALVRPRGSLTGAQRVARLARKPVFTSWRDRIGAEALEEVLARRCRVVEGSVADLGADPAARELLRDVDVVVHCASAVAFDAPVDAALSTNVAGTAALCEALVATGSAAHLVHVSTAYVAGDRAGQVLEEPLAHQQDWREECRWAEGARRQAERDSRSPRVLAGLARAQRRRGGSASPLASAAAREALRTAWVAERLVEQGRARARSGGWADAYAHSKALAERVVEEVWAGSGRPLTVVRPSIIESALQRPHPGWIDGYKTADPLIIAYGRGQLPQFPGDPESVLDVVPVDLVVDTVLAAAALPPPAARPRYLHATTGAANPLHLRRLDRELTRWFTEHPLHGPTGPVAPPRWAFPGHRAIRLTTAALAPGLASAGWLLERAPRSAGAERALDRVRGTQARVALLSAYTTVYAPYVETAAVFDDRAARALRREAAGPGAVALQAGDVDWRHYLHDVHLPAITAATRSGSRRPAPRRPAAPPAVQPAVQPAQDGVAVFALGCLVGRARLLAAEAALVSSVHPPRRRPAGLARWGADALVRGAGQPAARARALVGALRGVPSVRLVAGPDRRTALLAPAPGVLALVEEHRRRGHRTVLVTSAPSAVLGSLVDAFDDVVCAEPHEEAGVLTGQLTAAPPAGEALVPLLEQLLDARAAGAPRLGDAWGYGSTADDAAWLARVARPVALAPDPGLRSLARERRWPVRERSRAGSPAAGAPAAKPDVVDLRRPAPRLPHQGVAHPSPGAGEPLSVLPAGPVG